MSLFPFGVNTKMCKGFMTLLVPSKVSPKQRFSPALPIWEGKNKMFHKQLHYSFIWQHANDSVFAKLE